MSKVLVWTGDNLELFMRELSGVIDNFVARVDDKGNLWIWSQGSKEVIVGLGGRVVIEGAKIVNCLESNNVVRG